MQSRDLADGADSGGPIQGKTTINNSADTLTQLHMEGLLWALRAHQAAYRQAFPAKNIHQSVVDLTQKPPINPNTQVRFVDGLSAKQVELDHLQAIIDAAFEVCVRKGVSSGTLHKTLTDVAPVLNKILAGVGPDSLGAALYYKFKYFDLLSGYYRGLSQHDKEYEMLKFAHETWANMSKLGFYGTGNTVADPHKEISVILARMAGKECGGELSTPNLCSVGLKHVLQSVNYTAIAWLPKRFSLELLEVNAQISSTESTELFVQRLEQILAADAGLVGVSSKVLLALSRNFLLAAACFATDDSSSKMENSPFSPLSKYVIIAAHLCAVLKKRGEDCAPLQPQQAIYTEVENVADVAPRVTINGDNKKRVKLKRKKS